MPGRNVVVAQSGGPSPVINNSLRGIVEACREFPARFGRVYAALHGVEGLLGERLLDLTAQSREEIALLRTSPAAGAIGTCRYKLRSTQQEDFDRLIDVFRAHEIGFFFYVGGNDSMDTAAKIGSLAADRGLELQVVGVPKTIDNDMGDPQFRLIDHTPGYGSVARYWMCAVQVANEENAGSCPADPVLVLQAMGRRIGFIPAAARLADPMRELPLLIFLPECGLGAEDLVERVREEVSRRKRAVVVVSEGFDVGELGESRDAFGHVQFGSSKLSVQQIVVNLLNERGLPARGSARGQTPGTDQRSSMLRASTVDLGEAYSVGQQAVVLAAEGRSSVMATIVRKPGLVYVAEYGAVSLGDVANSERKFPPAWIAPDCADVTDDFIRYARPLIGEDWVSVPMIDGRERFARFQPVFAEPRLPGYVPQAYPAD